MITHQCRVTLTMHCHRCIGILDDDIVISEKDIKVYVDKASMAKLDGATVDFVESLQATGFKISPVRDTSARSAH